MKRTQPAAQRSFALGIGLAVIAIVWVAGGIGDAPASQQGPGNGQGGGPANKAAAVGSGMDFLSAPLVDGASSEVHRALALEIKTSPPTDLVISVTMECALWTDITTVGNDDSRAAAAVKAWVELDGKVIPVASDEDPASDDFGKVVFCNRAYQRTTSLFENENATIESFLQTRSANAFNWITFDVGKGTHAVEVFVQLESQVNGMGMAQAGIGKRVLYVDPIKMPVGSSI